MTVLLATAMLAESSAAFASDPGQVEWSPDWPRFRLVEAIDTVALAVGAYVINAYWKPPEHASWSSGILWDKAVRDALRGQTLEVQRTASNVSNCLYLGAVVAPLVIDNAVVALAVHRSPDVALQMTLIDAQALAMAGAVSLATEHAVGRARPYTTSCGPDGVVRDASGHPLLWSCGNSGGFQSFYSGHAADRHGHREDRRRPPSIGRGSRGAFAADGSLCGKFGAPASGRTEVHNLTPLVQLQPLRFDADRATFQMDYALVSGSSSPRQKTYVALAGRRTDCICLADGASSPTATTK